MTMNSTRHFPQWLRSYVILTIAVLAITTAASAQACYTAGDMDAGTRSSIERATQQYFQMASQGDYARLKSSAIPSLASNFSPIEAAIAEHQKDLQGAQVSSS